MKSDLGHAAIQGILWLQYQTLTYVSCISEVAFSYGVLIGRQLECYGLKTGNHMTNKGVH
jgi:hypothetical protein